ncbi:unnamed protein product [Aphanomyces euteiches]|uniref:G-protein coupled receptors family 1 profile domain-containing protein n=1 Tax=Aphanomyces euteiches TaxID=100861 RepID=A0A6G0XIB5_9STRA|nr:hypothetical protein Ae201684_004530 [Aphanomyces euteiches]KAH9093900.1 hypothetical protein Ae201684P_016520 [Aphanomyces euteiches]KAH9154207.1 hypothetical protein LEN26_003444 [Aphanomyces euteiches]
MGDEKGRSCYLIEKTTCCFGIYMEGNSCDVTNTYASRYRSEYTAYIIALFVVGVVSLLACILKLYYVNRAGGSAIQKQVYSFLVVASTSFVVRAVDPMGHDFIYSPLVSGMISDICTACLYSVLILSVAFWARIVLNPADTPYTEIPIRAFTALALFLTWFVFLCVRPIYLLLVWGDPRDRIFRSWHILIQYSMGPVLLLCISTLAIYFGVCIHRRLKAIREANERAMAIAVLRQSALSVKHNIVRSDSQDEPPSRSAFEDDQAKMQLNNNARILKVLVLMEILSLFAVGAQVYFLVDFIQNGCMLRREWNCSRKDGGPCALTFSMPILPFVQFAGIVVMYWSFRKTRPLTKETVTDELFSNRSFVIVMDGGASLSIPRPTAHSLRQSELQPKLKGAYTLSNHR